MQNILKAGLAVVAIIAAILVGRLILTDTLNTPTEETTSEIGEVASPVVVLDEYELQEESLVVRPTGMAKRVEAEPEPRRDQYARDLWHKITGTDPALESGPDCELEVRERFDQDGEPYTAFHCDAWETSSRHVYWKYPIESLEDMAHGDADAARVLGLRILDGGDLTERRRAIQYVYHSTVLTGDSTALSKAIPYFAHTYSGSVPQFENMEYSYVLSGVAGVISAELNSQRGWAEQLLEAGTDMARFKELDQEVEMILDHMVQQQRVTTGDDTIERAVNHWKNLRVQRKT